jgi:hypothetical protein
MLSAVSFHGSETMRAVLLADEQKKRTLRLQPFRLSEAEEIIASVWQLLERENIASPRLKATMTECGAQISLVFSFSGEAEALREALRKSGYAFVSDEATAI